MTTARNMGTWKSLIWLNILNIVGTIHIPLVHMSNHRDIYMHVGEGNAHNWAPVTLLDLLGGFSTVSFAFSPQFMVVEIMSEMKEPSTFPRAYIISSPFQGLVFLICGCGGYYFMGEKAGE